MLGNSIAVAKKASIDLSWAPFLKLQMRITEMSIKPYCYICQNLEKAIETLNNEKIESSFNANINSQTVTMRCDHVFHRSCLKAWLKLYKEKTCPKCDHEFVLSATQISKKNLNHTESQISIRKEQTLYLKSLLSKKMMKIASEIASITLTPLITSMMISLSSLPKTKKN